VVQFRVVAETPSSFSQKSHIFVHGADGFHKVNRLYP
jgi:hypothetical protein